MTDIVESNTEGRDFIVGDIHGCYRKLMNQLKKINFNKEKDRLFSVGDLIDRGPDSLKCLELMYEPWFYGVLGNHEELMINAVVGNEEVGLWWQNGGVWSEKVSDEKLLELAKDIPEFLSLTITVGDIGICHADPPSNWGNRETMTEKRKLYYGEGLEYLTG